MLSLYGISTLSLRLLITLDQRESIKMRLRDLLFKFDVISLWALKKKVERELPRSIDDVRSWCARLG